MKYQLPRDFAEKWIAALRSGAFGQTIGQLKAFRKNEYCCLGVACKITGTKSFGSAEWIGGDIGSKRLDKFSKKIPDALTGNGYENTLVREVSTMNDEGKTFPEIADWLELNVEMI